MGERPIFQGGEEHVQSQHGQEEPQPASELFFETMRGIGRQRSDELYDIHEYIPAANSALTAGGYEAAKTKLVEVFRARGLEEFQMTRHELAAAIENPRTVSTKQAIEKTSDDELSRRVLDGVTIDIEKMHAGGLLQLFQTLINVPLYEQGRYDEVLTDTRIAQTIAENSQYSGAKGPYLGNLKKGKEPMSQEFLDVWMRVGLGFTIDDPRYEYVMRRYLRDKDQTKQK